MGGTAIESRLAAATWQFSAVLLVSSARFGSARFGSACEGAINLAPRLAQLDVLPFVVFGFALPNCEENFYPAILPVEGKWHDGVAFDGTVARQFFDLATMEQQLSGRLGKVILDVAVGVFVDVSVVQPRLILFDAAKGVGNLPFPGPQRFHFRSVQN